MTALEAGGSEVVRSDWHKHISVPLQTGRGQTRGAREAEGTPQQARLCQCLPCPQI